jgi:glycosyltransferase involved in cell wall biosynthesis
MQTLSVVLATFNEEENLSRCLNSVKKIADEIVIVDGMSTDRTVAIAKKFGAKILVTKNLPNFHINKQKAIEMATKEWILQMDADEELSPELRNEIKIILNDSNKEINGYWMPRKNLFLGRFLMKGGQYPDYTLRLYKRGRGYLPQVHVHEQAVVEGKTGYLRQALLHYPYKDFKTYISKWNRYNELFAVQIGDNLRTKKLFVKIMYSIGYLIVKPGHWFLTTYIRHKGFMDSWQGFVFSLFSSLRFPVSYIKYISS